jgi:hypothetical protein
MSEPFINHPLLVIFRQRAPGEGGRGTRDRKTERAERNTVEGDRWSQALARQVESPPPPLLLPLPPTLFQYWNSPNMWPVK